MRPRAVLRSVRLLIKPLQFELFAILAMLLGLSIAGLVVIALAPTVIEWALACGIGPDCLPISLLAGAIAGIGQTMAPASAVVGVIGGLLLGVVLVGREVERGTAALAWPLARSRRPWLVARAAVVALLLVVAALAAATVSDLLVTLLNADASAASFVGWQSRGLVTVGRDLAALGLGILLGTMVGRVLPALLIGAIVTLIGFQPVEFAMGGWRSTEAVEIPGDGGSAPYEFNLVFENRYRDAEGRILTYEELWNLAPPDEFTQEWPGPEYQPVYFGLPGSYRQVIDAREGAVWGAIGLVLLGGSLVVIERRRPY